MCPRTRSTEAALYAEPPRTFPELLAPFPAEIRAIGEWLRALVLTEFPQVEENIYGGSKVANALYSIGGAQRVGLGIQPGPRSVKLFIHDPDHLGTPPFRLEGSGKHMRHIKFDAIPAGRRAELVALMRIPVDRRSTLHDDPDSTPGEAT
jgi:hypothetical protein